MSASVQLLSPDPQPAEIVPPLEPGDHLTRDEFERRYEAAPAGQKAELIEGVVYMPADVRAESHGSRHADLIGWLVWYRAMTPGVRVFDNTSTRLDLGNEPQPDAAICIDPALRGRAKISDEDYIEGAPELVAEIAASSVSIDLNQKLAVYCRNGVREYIVWRVQERAIDWFILQDGQYELLPLHPDGMQRSAFFPGLWLNPAAMIQLDIAAVLHALQRGLASPEHAAFLTTLQSRRIDRS